MNKKENIKAIFKTVSTILSWTSFGFLVLVGALLLFYVISAQVYASRGEAYEPYFSLYTIISPSMEPNIKVYDVILDVRVDDGHDVKVGDVITFISTGSLTNGMTITHRVVEIIEDEEGIKFRTRGDNNNSPDVSLVRPNEIIGKAVLKIPQLGRLQFLLANKGGWIFAILIPAVGIIVYDIIKMVKYKKVNKKIETSIQEGAIDESVLEQKRLLEQERIEKLKAALQERNRL